MVEDLPTMVAAAEANVPAEDETLPAAEERPAQGPTAEPAVARDDVQVPTWNLAEHCHNLKWCTRDSNSRHQHQDSKLSTTKP
jgi:hypothetical protein